jgi:hypothetical protein
MFFFLLSHLKKTCRDEEMVAIEEALRKLETLASFSEK